MKTLDFAQLKEMVSVIDVAKHLGYSDRTQWARSKRSKKNPCYESPNGDKIIITNPTDYSRQVFRNPYDSSDFGDVISFVGKRLNLDAKGITEYLTNFNKNIPVIKQQSPQNKIESDSKQFQSHYFKLSVLSGPNHNYLLRRNLSDETLYSPAFKDVFKDVQIPVFSQNKFIKHSDDRYIGVTYHTAIDSPISAIDYRNSEVKKFGITSQKSVSIGFSNIPAVIRNIKIAESPIDAASHYQINPDKNNETLYIFTGGNISLGQLLAIDKIILSQPNEVHTTLLFDKDVAGTIYDLNYLCHRLQHPLTNSTPNEALQLFDKEQENFPEINVQQSLKSVSLSINTDSLSSDQLKRIFNCEKAFNLSCVAKENMLTISADKNYEEISKLVELTKHVFPILSSISIEKTPVGKDWNNYLNKHQEESKTIVFDSPKVSDTNPLYDREYTSPFMKAMEEGLFPENETKQTKESPLIGYQFKDEKKVYEIYAIRADGKIYYHDKNDNTLEYNIHIDQFFQQIKNKEILPSQFNTVEKRNYAINYMNEFYPEKLPTQNLNNNQAAKPEILSQNKMNHMSTQNAGEQNTQKTAAEKLQGTMKLLGLKDVWEIIKPAFESWANDPNEDGRKSFKVENLTFRRTGFKDDTKGISTDMLANVELNFNKKNGTVYFNSFTPELMNSIIVKIKEPQSVKHTFDVFLKKDDQHKNLTLKAALNLLDGRSVHLIDNNWIKYDHTSKKIGEFKFDLERAIKENKKMDFSSTNPEHMDSALNSLLKGDFAMIGCKIDDKQVTIFLTADAQYKKIESNDSNLYKHLNQEERKARDEKLNLKQDEVQGKSMHP